MKRRKHRELLRAGNINGRAVLVTGLCTLYISTVHYSYEYVGNTRSSECAASAAIVCVCWGGGGAGGRAGGRRRAVAVPVSFLTVSDK